MSLTPEQRDRLWDLATSDAALQASELSLTLGGPKLLEQVGRWMHGRPQCAHTVTRCRLLLMGLRKRRHGHHESCSMLVRFTLDEQERDLYRATESGHYVVRRGSDWIRRPRPLDWPADRKVAGAMLEVFPAELTGFSDADRMYLYQLQVCGNSSLGGSMTPARFRRLIWPLLDNTANVEDWLSSRYRESLREIRALAASEAA
jgi:hypothetical protein